MQMGFKDPVHFGFLSFPDTSCVCEAVISPNIRQLQISTRINNCDKKKDDQNNLIEVLLKLSPLILHIGYINL